MKLFLAILLIFVVTVVAMPEPQNLIGPARPRKSGKEKLQKQNIVTMDLESKNGDKIKADVDVSKVKNNTGFDDLDMAQIIGQFLQENASNIIKQAMAQSMQNGNDGINVQFS